MSNIILEKLADRWHVTLNRPEARNAIDRDTVQELHAVCDALEREPRVLILSGAGGIFAAGADIRQLLKRGASDARAGINTNLFTRIAELPMPVIAVVDGHALGGGAELAYAADFRIASHSARFGNPETKLGIIAAGGALWRLPALVGEPVAKQVLLAGRILDAEESLRLNLVISLHEPKDLRTASDALVDQILKGDPLAIQKTKAVLAGDSETHPRADLEAQAILFESDAKTERMTAFLEGRR
ncbi:enoyl-CoA hydratase/isomerase family protein [Pseudarthrobacter sp. SSS035]|uniref:enoyl-CoA hydratase/isomerase family protein n=1 Tax=Pseudarthrobacter sp. SSS035 TaxID=2931399 RepID=UPI00200F2A84|nr:enoyl-CoA hydratase/isomerase family protein [Pseudarthrobacter sp. SSS035]